MSVFRDFMVSIRRSFKKVEPVIGNPEISLSSNLEKRFSEVYSKNIFRGGESLSGEGSSLSQTSALRKALPDVLKQLKVRSVLDAPCGDWHWMRTVELGVDRYFGVDIVESVILALHSEFGDETRSFQRLDLTNSLLPKADLIFCRDCLVHLNFADSTKIIANFKRSGAKYLMSTSFSTRKENHELSGVHSFWRTLNLELAPFRFPKPILSINEECTEGNGDYRDKSMGVWRLDEIAL